MDPIKECDGYFIDRLGRVWTVKPPSPTAKARLHPVLMRLHLGNHGYLVVKMRVNGRQVTRLVHRLVLEAFDRPPKPEEETRHINGDRTDNRIENLLWGTASENHQDRVRHGTATIGSLNGNSRLDDYTISIIRMQAPYFSQTVLAQAHGVSQSTISRVVLQQTYKSAGSEA